MDLPGRIAVLGTLLIAYAVGGATTYFWTLPRFRIYAVGLGCLTIGCAVAGILFGGG